MDVSLKSEIISTLSFDIQSYELKDVPLLAHYTSLDSLEKIVKSDQIWFSHPLLMNDHEEVRWGILQGALAVEQNAALKMTLSTERYKIFIESFQSAVKHYGDYHLFDTYVFCVSEHDPSDYDGRLSMWRGYGGNGTGAAIVFDPKKMNQLQTSPLIFDKVAYKTKPERFIWIANYVAMIGALIQSHNISNEDLPEFSQLAFDRLKLAAIFSKDRGFDEEREWRMVYMPDRDPDHVFKRFFGYLNGPKGLEPKLKFDVAPLEGLTAPDLSLEKLIDRIILGPSRSSPLAEGTARRMLEEAAKPLLVERLRASQIPFRS